MDLVTLADGKKYSRRGANYSLWRAMRPLDLANLPDGFAGKVLGLGQARRITIDTLWRLLAGTGTMLSIFLTDHCGISGWGWLAPAVAIRRAPPSP
jgi:hypothetical protein